MTKVRTIRTTIRGEEVIPPGQVIEAPDSEANALIRLGKCVSLDDPTEEPDGAAFNRSVGLKSSDTPKPTKRKS